MEPNEVIAVDDKTGFFQEMRLLAYAQLSANCELGVRATDEEKDAYVAAFDKDSVDQDELDDLMPTSVFEEYFNMYILRDENGKLLEENGSPLISMESLREAVNKLIYYAFMKMHSRMVDDGLLDMVCMPDGEINFVVKGQKPQKPQVEPSKQKKVSKKKTPMKKVPTKKVTKKKKR